MHSPPVTSHPSSSFSPRPFPPPSLNDVPHEYIVDQLRSLASHYWDRPQTADCTIIVPVPHHRSRPVHDSPTTSSDSSPEPSPDAARRATEPAIHAAPRMKLRLHMDYLSSHSTLLRGLFNGASPVDLIHTGATQPRHPPLHVPESRLPSLLPSPASHPTLFLPVPDPSSIHLIFHWMYFGQTTLMEDCLNRGVVHWEGIARNVEYLGLPTDIKVFLGRWYSNWLLPARSHPGCAPCSPTDDEDSDIELELDDDDETDDDDSSTSSSYEDVDAIAEFERGRTRTIRPLARLCGKLQMCGA
ncbi:hypothetical protein DEU56DRAFT_24580 [Suillus clintonianus]|uniref:uncharacterized protein n=1 Tax=Suillus clintonianus TaxID=1904413 RepID=UPI001B8605A7|nr:uncharacterized protein DEU56DRAFT_24580 [Suillus clintonianus]KAG2157531.1 hypothetical protein DEU56DRAFT_24580 [Suillus clintonianus]